ncbi:hypothetical protein NO1_1817 [Candidatus Termititenax aidoneus]|uniref:F5/8 type C domain-containing protein n=1 Tax=Termititenax aidoneus TaxID=2218524 RepID=A0A388TCS3_TERA1|nr:hypothetical protein NO1_1817 [Candidatus Termititenax aidoneus]
MTATVKFFDTNRINSASTFNFASADEARADILYDNDSSNRLFSNGSNDATPEVWEITFSSVYDLDALAVFNHNVKSGNAQYWTGTGWADFTPTVNWYNNTDKNSYFEFNRVQTQAIRLTMNTTQIANRDKYVGQLRALTKLGDISRNPTKIKPELSEKNYNYKTSDGGSVYGLNGIKYKATVSFQNSPAADQDFLRELKIRNKPFYFYPCGGTAQADMCFHLDDMYLVNFTSVLKPKLPQDSLFGIGISTDTVFEEV